MSHLDAIDYERIQTQLAEFETDRFRTDLDDYGYACVPRFLDPSQCRSLIAFYGESTRFRRRVVMQQVSFGRGEYQYFARPLPELIESVQIGAYERLQPIANAWYRRLRESYRFPSRYSDYRMDCERTDQHEPTPLMLRYGPGDYNRLHQDLYGESIFPLQLTVLLSDPDKEFSGGEFVITEQRPRTQSRVEVVPLQQGDAVVIPVRLRPVHGARGDYRVQLRHGVSRVRSGERYALGIIFHQAEK